MKEEEDIKLDVRLLPLEKSKHSGVSAPEPWNEDDNERDERDEDRDGDEVEIDLNINNIEIIQKETQQQSLFIKALWVTLYILIYLLPLLLLSFICTLLPSIPLPNFIGAWAQVWPLSTFIIFFLAMVAGFSFVARITEKRANPFKCRSDTYTHVTRLMISVPIVYLLGPIRALYYVSSDNDDDDDISSPHHSSRLAAISFNILFLFSFFVGIQFTYLDYIMMFRTAGDKFGSPSLWKTYTKRELMLIIPLALGILLVVAFQVYLISVQGLLVWYGVFYLLVTLGLVVPTVILRKSYYLHLHHYVIFGILIPFFAFPYKISVIFLGLMTGIYVEGIARWGMSGIWYPGAQRQY